MINRNALKLFALTTTCLVPLAAYAADDAFDLGGAPVSQEQEQVEPKQFDNEIGVGVKGAMGTNADQAGRYNGQTTTGISETLDFHLKDRPEWKSGDTWYYEANGNNINFQDSNRLAGDFHDNNYTSTTANNFMNDGSLNVKLGQQGTWGTSAYYDVISYTGNVIDSIYTVDGHTASLNGALLPFGGATATTEGRYTKSATTNPSGHIAQTPAMLLAAETPFQTGTRRDIIGGDMKYILGNWTFTTAGRHDHKEGTMEESLNDGYTGAAFTLPVNYDTDRYDLSAAYNTRQVQAIIQNTFSHFADNNNFFALPSPYSMTTAPYQTTAAYSTPPSNDADYMTVMLATNALEKTRINLNARYGVEMQNDSFAPNTADSSPLAAMTSGFNAGPGTSQTSLGAVAQVYQVNAAAISHPFANTDTRVFYNVDGRAVHQDVTQVMGANSQTSMDTAAPVNLIARPQEWLKQKFGGEAGYKIIPAYNTRLTVGYTRDDVDRSDAQVGTSYTNTETIGLHSDLGNPDTRGSLTYDHGDRSGSINYSNPWLAYGPNGSNMYEMYYSAAYYQAPMVSDTIKLRADYSPTEDMSGGFYIRFKNENYNYSADSISSADTKAAGFTTFTGVGQGIKNDYNLTVGPDFNYRPAKGVNTHFYYSYEQIFYNNFGNGACAATNSTAATCGTSSAGDFNNQYTSSVNTAGVSGDWQVTSKLKLGADYNFAYGSVGFGEYNGVYIGTPTKYYQNVSNYPDINSITHNLQLKASYELMPNMELVTQFSYTMFRSNDWNDYASSVQQAGTSAVSYLTPGYGTPNYDISTIMTGIKIRF